jgi:hypothetical protein
MVMAALVASSAIAPQGLRCGMRSLNWMLSSFDCRQQSPRGHKINTCDDSGQQPTLCSGFGVAKSNASGSAAEACEH